MLGVARFLTPPCQLYENSRAFRRIKIRPVDALRPFLVLFILNISLLTAWTVVDPWQWERVDGAGEDRYGRVTDSYGECKSSNYPLSLTFAILLAAVNFIPVILAIYLSYRARNLPSEFNESRFVTLSMASLLEAGLIGLPIVIMTREEPTAFFMARSLVIFVVCFVVLLFMFVPKWMTENKPQVPARKLPSSGKQMTSATDDSSNVNSKKMHPDNTRKSREIRSRERQTEEEKRPVGED